VDGARVVRVLADLLADLACRKSLGQYVSS